MLDVRHIEHENGFIEGSDSSLMVQATAPNNRLFAHLDHAGCCLTPSFENIMATSGVPVLVVDGEGFVIYINAETEALIGYRVAEIRGKHITEIVDATPNWVASEFSYLADNRLWSGSVLLKRETGANLRVTVNAFKSLVPSDTAEYIAFLHGASIEGPAICRLPDVEARSALSADEFALLEMLSEGFVEKEIAAITGAPVSRIDRELQKLLEKLNASSRTEACVRALREGLLAA
jgi:PAS domain S-box-containing protein